MNPEFLEWARAAAQEMDPRAAVMWAQAAVTLLVGVGQCGIVAWFLWKEGKRHKERVRKNDQQGEALGKVGQALDRQMARLGAVLDETRRARGEAAR